MNGKGKGRCLEGTFNRLWELGHSWRPQNTHIKSPKLIILPYLHFSTMQAAGTRTNIQKKCSRWLHHFSDPSSEGPRSWDFCYKQRISAEQKQLQKKMDNWNHIELCKVMLTPSSTTWCHGLGMGSSHMWCPPSPCVPSVYHGQCIHIEILLHVCLVFIATTWLDFPQEFLISGLSMHLHSTVSFLYCGFTVNLVSSLCL